MLPCIAIATAGRQGLTHGQEYDTYLEYHGGAGTTDPCMQAVEAMMLSRRSIRRCRILTSSDDPHPSHALLLTDAEGCEIVVKSGFKSGYQGAGPNGLSATLALLDWHGVALEEVEVDNEMIRRLDASALTVPDLEAIRAAKVIRPARLWDYVREDDETGLDAANPWRRHELLVPLQLIDDRLSQLARDFWQDPDVALLKAHRMLEEAVKAKAGLTQLEANQGPAKVMALAFNPPGRLHWPGVVGQELTGRANLFVGTVGAYRNPRAHRVLKDRPHSALGELLLLNHLFQLEAEAEPRSDDGGALG